MIVCPLCEHSQAEGDTCDGCGRVLISRAAAPVPTAPLPELEQTALRGGAAPVVVSAMPELEMTRAAAVQVPDESFAEVERTRADSTPDVASSPIADLERGRTEDDGVRTALPTGG